MLAHLLTALNSWFWPETGSDENSSTVYCLWVGTVVKVLKQSRDKSSTEGYTAPCRATFQSSLRCLWLLLGENPMCEDWLFVLVPENYVSVRYDVLVVGALDSWWSVQSSNPVQSHCVIFSGKTFSSRNASLYPGHKWMLVNLMLGVNPATDFHSIQGE